MLNDMLMNNCHWSGFFRLSFHLIEKT